MKKSSKNIIGAVTANATAILVSFFAQKIFLLILNKEFLGLNGFFTNIISMLAIFELGIGNAITFSLYKPLVKNDKKTIGALMNFYQKAYRLIAIIVSITSITITPLLPLLIRDISININIFIVYALFVLDTVCSYLLTYRRSILYADQKNYQINIIHIGYLLIMNILQLLILATTKNYYLYLAIKVLMRVAENVAISLVVAHQYPYLHNCKKEKLNRKTEKEILRKVKALILHKVGSFLVNGSDNIIISKFIGLVAVGLYSNYELIVQAINQLSCQAITSLTPTVGHKLAINDSKQCFNTFGKVRFAGFLIACFASSLFFSCIQPFICLWLGPDYLFNQIVIVMLTIVIFQKVQRFAYSTFQEAAGIYYENRFAPIFESILNIVASIILLQFFGIAGVFMGTIVSGLALWCYSYPKFVYKKLFGRSYFAYARETLGYIAVFVASAAISYLIISQIHLGSAIMQIVANAGISVGITGVVIILTLHRTGSFRYFDGVITGKVKKVLRRP